MGKSRKPRLPNPPAPGDGRDETPHDGGSSFPVHEHVGRHLKALFDEVTSQPVPDKFIELLEELERKQERPSKGSK